MYLVGGSSIIHRFFGSGYYREYWWEGYGWYIWGHESGLLVSANNTTNNVRHFTVGGGYYGSTKTANGGSLQGRHVFGLSPTVIWVVGSTGVWKYNSGTDQYDLMTTFSSTTRARLVADAEDNVWVTTDTEVWHWNGSTWTDRASELSGSPTSFHDVRIANGVTYVLAHDATPTGKIYRYDGSWTNPHTFNAADLPIVLWVWSDDEMCVAQHYTSWRVYAFRWDGGPSWHVDLIYSRDTYQWGTPYVEDIHSLEPGHYAICARNPDFYGPPGHVWEYHASADHWDTISYHASEEVRSLTSLGAGSFAANIKDDLRDDDGRYLISDLGIRDVKIVNPSTDPGFGATSHVNFHGAGYDSRFKKAGQLTAPGGDIGFGKVATGLNTLAWHNAHDGPPYAYYTSGSGAPDPNTTYTVEIPADDELRLGVVQSAGAATSQIILVADRTFLIPPGDFVLSVDIDVENISLGSEIIYAGMRLVGTASGMRDSNPYTPPNGDDWSWPSGACIYDNIALWYYTLGQVRHDTRYTENGSNSWPNTLFSGAKAGVTDTKLKFTRVGNDLTMSAWDPDALGGVGDWINTTKTLGEVFTTYDWSPWCQQAMMFMPQFWLYCSVGGGGLNNVNLRYKNLSYSGAPIVTYDHSMNLWLPFDYDQGEANGLPDEPTALILDKRSASFVDLVNEKLAWRLSRNDSNGKMAPQYTMNIARQDNIRHRRIAYHDGLLAVVYEPGTIGIDRSTIAEFLLMDLSLSEARRFAPGYDATTAYAGGIYGGETSTSIDTPGYFRLAVRGVLDTIFRGARNKSGPTSWQTMADDPSKTLPWRCIDGDARDAAVYRDMDGYAYYIGASEGGAWFTKHRPYYESDGSPDDTNAAHTTTYSVEVIAIEVDKTSGDMFWLTAAGAFYYAAKATWQAMGETTPNSGYYINGFAHDATTSFPGTLTRQSQERIATAGTVAYIGADEGIYTSTAGGSFSLLYGSSASAATHKILPDGTTSVDVACCTGERVLAMCYNSTSQHTILVGILISSNAVILERDVTDELGGVGQRANCLDAGEY